MSKYSFLQVGNVAFIPNPPANVTKKFQYYYSHRSLLKMSVSAYDAVAEKVLLDLELAIKKNPAIDEFHIIPTQEEENKNSSPILKGENTLGLESWIIAHIYPYAHHQIMQRNNYKTQNICKLLPCLTGVALLNPEMPTVWNRRRELVASKKLHVDNELRLAKMALSRKPKCNDALTYRRWILMEMLKNVQDKTNLLKEELKLSEMIANRYHSNYHAWSHRMWSLQHLLPECQFHNFKKTSQKNCLYETMSVESCEIIHRAITRNELSYLKTCIISQVYFEDLENNFNWISSHVSDHSGMHFRKYLIMEIFSYIKNLLNFSSAREFQNELDFCYSNAQFSSVTSLFTNGKINVVEFLSSFKYDSSLKKAVDEYLRNLDQEITLFDVTMFIIVTELKSNHSLCLIFSGHEALWCYRRFLIFLYKQLIDTLDYNKNNSESKLYLHQDKNGIPHQKDFKFDNEDNSESIPKHSDLYLALYLRLVTWEEEIISKLDTRDSHIQSLYRNYSHWLRICFKENEV